MKINKYIQKIWAILKKQTTPKLIAKLSFIALCGLIIIHILFNNSIRYTISHFGDKNYYLKDISQDEYQIILNELTVEEKVKFIKNTEISHFIEINSDKIDLNEDLIFKIYSGYFIVAILLLLTVRIKLKDLKDE